MAEEKKYTMEYPSDTTLKVTKWFDGPIDLVFKIHTDRELIPQWWGPKEYSTIIDKLDFVVGGEWRFVQKDQNGNEYAFHGEFKEIEAPNRFVQTFIWEGLPDKVITSEYIFEEKDGKTLYTSIDHYETKEDREGMIQSGMESGMSDGFDKADALLATLK